MDGRALYNWRESESYWRESELKIFELASNE